MPLTVTWYSCIASSSAACVLGGVRLISSARITFANTGPGMNRISRRPVARSSSMTSVPMMSDGIRSGVNWMRLNLRWTACASVLISSVFARPGTPRSRQWPPAKNTVRISWTTVCWPMMARPSSSRRRDARRCASSNESIGRLYQRTDELLRQTGCVQAMRPFDSSTFARTYSSSPRNTYSAGLDSASLRI